MLIKKPDHIKFSEITTQSDYLRRRDFLKKGLYAFAGLGLSGIAEALVKAPGKNPVIANLADAGFSVDEDLTPYDLVTSYNNYYEFGTGKSDPVENSKAFESRPWHVVVDGECEEPGEIDIEDILTGITQEERIYRLRCVEAWSMVVPWVGFPLSTLLKRFKPTAKAKYVSFETLHDAERMPGQKRAVLDWPYREGLRIDEAMHPLTILATGLYGELLPNQNGAPLRLVVPWKYGFKSIKGIVRIRFSEEQPQATWNMNNPREYGFYSNVNPRVEHPRWSQKYHRVIGGGIFSSKVKTEMFNGYADEVASLYTGMDLRKNF
ncbi:mononuclear molybdenum enzyme YedY [Solemya velum gill symbiont]|uniref:protein-methionine-sulfoxide reductase catalytic subunit MsrP n=1 Tax=Solemya velum gill symbiont TaxID=2340 RepID=UPI0009976CAE|nr:protein-methionine-sulfoxide reductase catalytic subunit MsrP [Solemya velum gill symbiont]OOZ15351.1 mononuclear molybdenum enzyme YedY [Solemya velum gill symbiont]